MAGYQADTIGLTAGIDTDRLVDNATLGVSFSYGQTKADADNVNATHSDIDSYQLQLYGDYNLPRQTFIEGALGYGYNTIDRTRFNVGGVAGAQAKADYNSAQYVAALAVGQNWTPLPKQSPLTITPKIGVRYTHLATDDFHETGAGGLNLNGSTQDKDALEFTIGTQIAYPLAVTGGTLSPSVHAGYTYDAIGDSIQTASNFTGGGASFNTQGTDPARSTFNLGAGLSFYSHDGFDLSAQYDAQIKQNYTAHAGFVRMAWAF